MQKILTENQFNEISDLRCDYVSLKSKLIQNKNVACISNRHSGKRIRFSPWEKDFQTSIEKHVTSEKGPSYLSCIGTYEKFGRLMEHYDANYNAVAEKPSHDGFEFLVSYQAIKIYDHETLESCLQLLFGPLGGEYGMDESFRISSKLYRQLYNNDVYPRSFYIRNFEVWYATEEDMNISMNMMNTGHLKPTYKYRYIG